MLPFWIASLPFVLISRALVYSKTKKLNPKREAVMVFFIVFATGFLSQTLIPPEIMNGNFTVSAFHLPDKSQIFLNPLSLFHWLYLLYKFKNFNGFMLNYVGNVIMMIPFGFCIPILWKKVGNKVIIIGFFVSVFIEISQLFFNRVTDISDVILNVLGTYLGYLIYKAYLKVKAGY